MAARHYFHNVSVSGFSSSSEPEDGFNPLRDPEDKAGLFNMKHGMNDVNSTGGSLFCEDLATVCIADGAEDEQVGPRVPTANSEDPAVAMEQSNAGTSTAVDRDGSSCADPDGVVDGCVSDQHRPGDGLEASTGDSDSGYETPNMNGGQGREETGSGTSDPEMPELEYNGEASVEASRVNSINIYCNCCSKQVKRSVKLKNKLCKDCIAVTEDTEGDETLVETVSVPCAICTKRFAKSRYQYHQMCKECISIMVEGYQIEVGVETRIIGCTCCQRPFSLKSGNLHETLCPQCQYIIMVQPLGEPIPFRLARPKPQNDNPTWTDIVALQGYTSIIVKTYTRDYFYRWCDGHRAGNDAQEDHQCLEKPYAVDVVRRVCYTLCPHIIVKMIKSMQMNKGLRMDAGAERVVNKVLYAIYRADDPFLKMRDLRRGAPRCVRTRIEKTVGEWVNRMCTVGQRVPFKPLRRKLTL